MVSAYKFIDTGSNIAPTRSAVSQNVMIRYDERTEKNTLREKEELWTAASDVSLENILNRQRMNDFQKDFSKNLLCLLREQDFEYGMDTPADKLVAKSFSENEVIAKEWLNRLFVENFESPAILTGILRIVSHFDYCDITPQGPTMALAALANTNTEVRECGIRAFEGWVSFESLKVLKNTQCKEEWLNDYLHQVIEDLEEELSEHGITD